MIDLHGKTLVFGDLHLGIKSDSLSRLLVDVNFVNYLVDYIKSNKIENCIFLGDWFNSREYINTITLSVGYEIVSILAKSVKNLVFILGNHDLESNVYHDVSSVGSYASIPNIHVISKPTEGIINNSSILFVPWGYDKYDTTKKFKYVMGHMNVPSRIIRYNKVSVDSIEEESVDERIMNDVRKFSKLLDAGGVCFSGHIHNRTENTYKGNRIIFIGSPIELTYGETNTTHGFYVIDVDNRIDFVEVVEPSIPKHVFLRLSQCFDENGNLKPESEFAYLRGNIVKKIIDKDLTNADSMKLNDLLNSQDIFEYVQSEYGEMNIMTEISGQASETGESITLEKYFDIVADSIDKSMFEESNITKDDLKAKFIEYVDQINLM